MYPEGYSIQRRTIVGGVSLRNRKVGGHGLKQRQLVVFDVEGVLIPKRRYLLFETARKIGLWGFVRILVIGMLYEIGLVSLESSLRRIFMMLQGLTVDEILQLYRKIPLMPNAKEVFEKLNELGCRTALISLGLPALLVEDLATRLNADYAFGLELEIDNAHLTGAIRGDVLKSDGKATILKRILDKDGLSPQDCVVVADDRNNLPMFPLCRLRIGYNPDFILSRKSDFVVRDDLSEVIPIITNNNSQVSHTAISRRESIRETIHIGSFFLPFVCVYLLGNSLVFSLILLLTLLYIISEVARLQGTNFPIISKITWRAANRSEFYEFATAPVFFALGILLSLALFPESIGYAAITTLTLGDGFATIFGRRFGKVPFPFNKGKNVEGSFFGFLVAFIGAMFFVDPVKAFVGAAVGMLIESLPLPINDNLAVPLATGIALMMIS